MDKKDITNILTAVRNGSMTVSDAVKALQHFPYEDISFAKVDHHRHLARA